MATSANANAKQAQVFPLMQLPLELRQMVYREIQRRSNRDHLDMIADQGQSPHDIARAERAIAFQEFRHRTNILRTNKQVNAEATEVWYDTHFFQATIDYNLRIEIESAPLNSFLPMPAYLPKIRNLEIHLKSANFLRLRKSCLASAGTLKDFARLCYEVAAHCPRLRNVVLGIPCACSPSKGRHYPTMEHEKECLPVEMFDQLLKPLERLRVSQSITLESSCKKAGERLQPVFNRVTALARTSQPVEDLEGNEKVWWNLKETVKPFLRYELSHNNGPQLDVELCHALAVAHVAADVKLMKDCSPVLGGIPGYMEDVFRAYCQQVKEVLRDGPRGYEAWSLQQRRWERESSR